MRFFHLSDLHIGKQLHSYSLLEHQKYILTEIVEKAREYHPDAVLICGDIYDKTIPSAEAYTVLDEFFSAFSEITPKIPLLLIAGNHDCAERLNYAGGFLKKHQIYIAVLPPENEKEFLQCVTCKDDFGEVRFYLLPFLKPSYVRPLFSGDDINSYEKAIQKVLEREAIDWSVRNVLLSHQFYVNGKIKPETCDSEQISLAVGGLDSVDVSLVEAFDYVALGHIHGAQKVKQEHIRYCGTPLKYSVSEEHHQKSITMVTLNEKGSAPLIEQIPLIPKADVRKIKGSLLEVLKQEKTEDFVSVILTDNEELYQPKERLLEVFENLLEYHIENSHTGMFTESEEEFSVENPLEMFRLFYEEMKGETLSEEELAYMQKIFMNAREEEA